MVVPFKVNTNDLPQKSYEPVIEVTEVETVSSKVYFPLLETVWPANAIKFSTEAGTVVIVVEMHGVL